MKAVLPAHQHHPRTFQDFRFVYPVLSRRSGGISIGLNVNPDKKCNFDCLYCQVDRTVEPAEKKFDLRAAEKELRAMLAMAEAGELARHPQFADVPKTMLRLQDVAISGDGEPTTLAEFADTIEMVVRLKPRHVRLVLVTDGAGLDRAEVKRGLATMDAHHGEVWAESYRTVALRRGRKKTEQVHVVRSGPDLEKFTPAISDPSFRRGRKFLIGYLGVMGPQDGLDHLLRAAEELVMKRGRRDIQFCLIGDGPMFEQLQRMACKWGIAEHIEFTGRIPDEEMIARLSSCDVCVNPDPLNPLNDVSTMNKIMEYMALGKPIVQYDLKEGRFSAGEASWYARPNDTKDLATKIEELLANEPARMEMGQIGRRRMEASLAWNYQAPRLLRAYAMTLG